MRRFASILLAVLIACTTTGPALAQTPPEFKLGFKALADQVPVVVGQPLENEHWGANGDSLQMTSNGLMAWRKADNWTAFTNGSRTWVNGPFGVWERGNGERFEWEAPAVRSGGTTELSGVFYNTKSRAGGTADIKLQIGLDRISGEINLTQQPEDNPVLCGAGSFSAPRQGNNFTVSFTSNDQDRGCGGDRSTVFTLKANLDDNQSHIWGTFSTASIYGSQVVDPLGVFEAWTSATQPANKKYGGTFHLSSGGKDGVISMDIRKGTNTVTGYMDFDNHAGQAALCGAGEFSGEIRGTLISASFVSRDPDQGCAGNTGTRFFFNGDLADGDGSLAGTYGVTGNERVGTFEAKGLSAN